MIRSGKNPRPIKRGGAKCRSAIGIGLLLLSGAAVGDVPAKSRDNDPAGQAPLVPSLAATIAAMPKNLPRERAPDLLLAIAAARAAMDACAARGAKVSVLISDVAAKPVVLLSGNGAGVRSQLIAQTKANIVARFGTSSEEVARKAKIDPTLIRQAAADPGIGMLRGGGLPVKRQGELIGIVAVSGGGLGGDLTLDEQCATVAVSKLEHPQ